MIKKCTYVHTHHSTVHHSQDMESTSFPSADEGIKKIWHIGTAIDCEILFSLTKGDVLLYVII